MSLRQRLEAGAIDPAAALAELAAELGAGLPRARRTAAYQLVGELAGRAFDTPWETAEAAAWVLLGAALGVDTPAERRELLRAMGRGFRNLWLVPYVHARITDDDEATIGAAIEAAGGLAFPGLESVLITFLDPSDDDEGPEDDDYAPQRLAAIRALGRAGAASAANRLAALAAGEPRVAAAALAALTEIHSAAGIETARAILGGTPARDAAVAAVGYLAEMGDETVLPHLRRLGRDADPELRLLAAQATRAFQAGCRRDIGERLLAALTERDRVVRAALARRLRPLPIDDVLAEAEMLLGEDAAGVVQVVAELRGPEVTRFLLAVAADAERPELVRARAIGSIEADEPWEREALIGVALDDARPERVRLAAAQSLGAFASQDEVLARLAPLSTSESPGLRGAFLWALQLAARPRELGALSRGALERLFRAALADPDPAVRRRAAYVAGNLRLEALAPEIIELVRTEEERPELRVAAFVALQELAPGGALGTVVALFRREDEPAALVPASRAVQAAAERAGARPELGHLAGKLALLVDDADPRRREAALRVAGLAPGALPVARIVAATSDPAPRVREAALAALGRLHRDGSIDEPALAALGAAMDDADEGIRERAAEALLAIGGERALGWLLDYASGDGDPSARAAVAARLVVPPPLAAKLKPAVARAVDVLRADDPAWEGLCRLRITLSEGGGAAAGSGGGIDQAVAALFPTWTRLAQAPGFAPLAQSLRTAEGMYRASGAGEGDGSPPIILWMKCLEGYVHAWLSRRLQQKQNQLLWDHTEKLAAVWPVYQRWLGERWPERLDVGGLRVELPLRSIPNALRELNERRTKRLDSPLSVTEWARLLVLLGVQHPCGIEDTLGIAARTPDQVIQVAHRLCTLAAVRNAVTHRTSPPPAAVEAFRRGYYTGFEELTSLA